MKKILVLIIILSIQSCNCNQDANYIRGYRKIKAATKNYIDSINKVSKEHPDYE